jgi:hypothetical protein
LEAQEHAVGTEVLNVGVLGEAVAHGGEIDGAVALVDLDGVASAEGDVGAAFAGEVGEDSVTADSAAGTGGAGVDLAALVAPEVEGEKSAADEMGLSGEELEGFGGLDGGGEVDGGGEDAGGVAGFYRAGGGLGEDAGEAGGGKAGSRE